jgi:hypothetical protein
VPITGRLFVVVSETDTPEPRQQSFWINSPQFMGVEVADMKPGQVKMLDDETRGYPYPSLRDLPTGDYYVQAVLRKYEQYPRADGHTIWALAQWDLHNYGDSPGGLFSSVQRIHIDPLKRQNVSLELDQVSNPPASPPDSDFVRHIKIKSKLLSAFWGRSIYIGAVVLLPKGYADHPAQAYPVIYQQQLIFDYQAPFAFTTVDIPESPAGRAAREAMGVESGYQFFQAWQSDHFPRVIAVVLQHPTPYSEESGARNSENTGPYGDAIVKELLPYIESHYRIIRQPYARALVGKSAGGLDALTLSLHNPKDFGGAWMFYPWAFDFRHLFALNIYDDKNAYTVDPDDIPPQFHGPWGITPERVLGRTTTGQPFVTMREFNHNGAVQVERWFGGEFGYLNALFGPVGADGYPKPLWDMQTGVIDHSVSAYWRDNADPSEYARRNWTVIGPDLVGKLHFYVGEEDEYARNIPVHLFDDFLSTAKPDAKASFTYMTGKGMTQPISNADIVRIVAASIASHAPQGANTSWMSQ